MHASSTMSIAHAECEDVKPITFLPNHKPHPSAFAPSSSSSDPTSSRSTQIQRHVAWAKACGKAVTESRLLQAAAESRLHALADVSLEVCKTRDREMIRAPLSNGNPSPSSSTEMDIDEGCPPLSPAAASDDSDSDTFDSSDELATPPDALRQGARRGSFKPLGPAPWVRRSECATVVDHREGMSIVTRYEMIEESNESGVRVYRRMGVTTVDGPRHRPYTVPLRRAGQISSLSSDSAPQLARMNAPMVPLPPSLPPMAKFFETPSMSASRRPAPRLNLRLPTSQSLPANDHRRAASTLRVSQVQSSSRALQSILFSSHLPPTTKPKPQMMGDDVDAGPASLAAPFEFVEKDRSLCSHRGKAVRPLRLV